MSVVVEPRTILRIFDEHLPHKAPREVHDGAQIARELDDVGVRFERWDAQVSLAQDAGQEEILAAYADSIARVQRAGGYRTVDVLRIVKGMPDSAAIRTRFLDEHAHAEDEVRFFVEGSGAFYLRLGGSVYQAILARGDLLNVPAGTRHWFDMGPEPHFTALRWFNTEAGWVPQFTGDPIAACFPRFE